ITDKRGGVEGKTTETNVRHILIAPNEIRTMDEAQILANEVREKLAQGEGFIQLARKYSDDPGSALSGGDLGWTEPGVLVPIFEETMNNAEIGVSSQAFQSQFGWHILEVSERREKDLSQQRAAQQARMAIAETKYEDELNNWLQELRDNAFVDIK
ncbi:MAG: peptidyl-prolyl cis-trans isomerase, partial [Pseudomonadales bacterium]